MIVLSYGHPVLICVNKARMFVAQGAIPDNEVCVQPMSLHSSGHPAGFHRPCQLLRSSGHSVYIVYYVQIQSILASVCYVSVWDLVSKAC